MYLHSGMEHRQTGFYVEFSLHCLNLLAAILLLIGLGSVTERIDTGIDRKNETEIIFVELLTNFGQPKL